MKNIKYIDINIINNLPINNSQSNFNKKNFESEDFLSNFSNLSLKKEMNTWKNIIPIIENSSCKKDLAYNYYFGNHGVDQYENLGLHNADRIENEETQIGFSPNYFQTQPNVNPINNLRELQNNIYFNK